MHAHGCQDAFYPESLSNKLRDKIHNKMISEAVINLGLVAATCLLLMVYFIKFIVKYKHEYESNPLCTSAVVLCLMVVLVTTFILPIDVFLVSIIKENDGALKPWATAEILANIDTIMFTTYYVLYSIISILVFILVPFLYFLNGETETSSRANALKYTLFFVLFTATLLVLGVIFHNKNPTPNTIFDKIAPLKDMTKLEGAALMVLAVMMTAGFTNVVLYTASGLFSWPIGLILGTSSVSKRHEDIRDRSDLLRMRVDTLMERSRTNGLTDEEREQLVRAENELRQLDREEGGLSGYSSSWTYKLRLAIRPVQILVGLLICSLSLVLLATLIIVNIDRIMHGAGPKQGYVLLEQKIFNPLELIFTKLQDFVFVGPLPLLVITSFLSVATVSGVRNLGLWLVLVRVYRVKVARTHPQALLYFCATIMLAAVSFNLLLYSMASRFISFGSQNFKPQGSNTTRPCSLADHNDQCIFTRSSILIMQTISNVWIFGTIFYWLGWAFIVVATVSLIAYIIRGRRPAAHEIIVDEEDFEE